MTALGNRPNAALLVIDVQNGIVKKAYDRDTVVARISTLIDKARGAEVDVVWIQHNSDELPRGSENWQCVSELVPRGHGDHRRRHLRRDLRHLSSLLRPNERSRA